MCAALLALVVACDGNGALPPDAPTPDAPNAGPAILAWDGTPYDVGLTEVGGVRTRSVTLRNDGGVSTGVVLSTDGAALRILEDDCVSLAPGATCSATIELTVSAGGPVSRELRALPVVGGDAAVAPVTAVGGFRLDVALGGAGGLVTSSPTGINCGTDCSEIYVPGTTVTLTASFTDPTTFVGWTGDCTGTSPTCAVTVDAELVVGAVFDTPVPPDTLTIQFAGTGAGVIRSGNFLECAGGPCVIPANGTFTLTQYPISGSTFAGWSGCTPSGDNCEVTVGPGGATVTVTYNTAAPATWVRSANRCPRPQDMALAPAGLVVAGNAASGNPTSSALWIGRYATDGTPGHAFVDDVSSGDDGALRVAVEPGGDAIVLAEIDGALTLRRYTPTGSLVYSVATGGSAYNAVNGAGLALDASGNVYVSGLVGAVPYIASYLPTGVERWRVDAPAGVETIQGLTVRGAVLAAVGQDTPRGWVGTFDLAGNLRWQRTVAGLTMNPNLTFYDAAILGNGDVFAGGLDYGAAPLHYTMGAVTADGSAEYRRGTLTTRWSGKLQVHSDDTARVWIGYTTIGQEPSRVLVLDAAGSQSGSSQVPWVWGPGGVAIDPGGDTFVAGWDWRVMCSMIQRRP